MKQICHFERSVAMTANGGDWRSKSLAPMLMISATLDGFYFANCVLAEVASTNVYSMHKYFS